MRKLLIVIVAGLLAAGGTLQARAYDGVYAKEPKVKALLADLGNLKARALVTVEERIGLKSDGKRIVILVADMPQKDGPHAWMVTKGEGDKTQYQIILALPPVLAGTVDPEEEVPHEMMHAVMREQLGAVYDDMPTWIREAFAVWGSGQAQGRLEEIVAGEIFAGNDPEKIINGFETKPHNLTDYAEDALFMAYAEKRLGLVKIHRAVQLMKKGTAWKKAFSQAAGISAPIIMNRAREHAVGTLAELLGFDYRDYRKAHALYKAGKFKTAVGALQTWIAKYPDSFLQANARYLTGKCAYRAKDYRTALKHFSKVAREHASYLYIADDSLYRTAKCLTQLKMYDQAIQEYARLLNYFPRTHPKLRADALYWLGVTYQGKGEFPTAVEVYAKCRAARISTYHGDAFLKTGIAYFQNKELEKAQAVLMQVKKQYPQWAPICDSYLGRITE